jgi:hypothetical protein
MPVEPQAEQPTQDSVQDRIGSILEGDSAPEPEAVTAEGEPTAPVEETFEVDIEGEKYVLPKKLEKSFLQEKDYTQKAQSLAEHRRALDVAHEQARIAQFQQQFSHEVAAELNQLRMLDAVIQQTQQSDWASMSTDEIIRKRLDLDTFKDQRNEVLTKVQGKEREWGEKQQTEFNRLKAQAVETISKRIPGWSESVAKSIKDHAISEGYTEAEMASIIDPRQAVTLWKAQQFDQLQAKAQKTVGDIKSIKTTPTNGMPQQVKDKLSFHKAMKSTQRGSPEHQRIVGDRIAKLFG